MTAQSLRWALLDTGTIARRDLILWVREPVRLAWGLGTPIFFVLLFGYVLGSSIVVPGGGDYREFLMPGLFAMTMAFGIGNTMVGVAADAAKGITDRFRSIPMAPSAVVAGRCAADMVNSCVDLAVLGVCALVVGWSWNDGVGNALLAFGLLLLLRFSLLWVGICFGLMARTVEAATNGYSLLFPLTMLSNVYVSPEAMPGWLGFVAEWNPLSSVVLAVRELFGNPGVVGDSWIAQHATLMAVVWPIVLTAAFLPLAVRRYQSMSR